METANQSLPNTRGLPDNGLGQGHRSIHGGNNQPNLTSQEAIEDRLQSSSIYWVGGALNYYGSTMQRASTATVATPMSKKIADPPAPSSSPDIMVNSAEDTGGGAGGGGGHYIDNRWLFILPMLAFVQSYNGFLNGLFSNVLGSALLALASLLCYWAATHRHTGKIYKGLASLISLLRYRRVERHCDNCEQQLLEQLNRKRQSSSATGSLSPVIQPQLIGWRLRWIRKLPLRAISRHWGTLANTQLRPEFLNTLLIWLYAKGFGCNLEEAEYSIYDYKTLGSFFTRKLKIGARPVDVDPCGHPVSPADGLLTHAGTFRGNGYLEQVKGIHYSLPYFLGLTSKGGSTVTHAAATIHSESDPSFLLHSKDGSTVLMQMVIYLSPGDYHRFHSPADWTVETKRHFPGELLSVKPSTANHMPGLLHLNERVAWLGKWRHGFFSMTAVAALNVGDIVEDGCKDLQTNKPWGLRKNCTFMHTCSQLGKKSLYFSEMSYGTGGKAYSRGQPFGHFNFGSTIVLLFEAPRRDSEDGGLAYRSGDKLKVGKSLFVKQQSNASSYKTCL